MSSLTKKAKVARKSLYQMGYKYLCDNFHKFKTEQKIRIAVEMVKLEHTKPLVDLSENNTFNVTIKRLDSEEVRKNTGQNRISEYFKHGD